MVRVDPRPIVKIKAAPVMHTLMDVVVNLGILGRFYPDDNVVEIYVDPIIGHIDEGMVNDAVSGEAVRVRRFTMEVARTAAHEMYHSYQAHTKEPLRTEYESLTERAARAFAERLLTEHAQVIGRLCDDIIKEEQ